MALREARDQGMSTSSGAASALKRIQRELKEIMEAPSQHWACGPVGDELFEWHFAIRGPPGTDFEGGIYTGRIVLPANYPFAPPSITMLTPSGRFEVGKKICLSISNYHPELWQPSWGIRTMMEALRSHFPTPGDGAIGALDWPSDVRKRLAAESLQFICPIRNQRNCELLPMLNPAEIAAEGGPPTSTVPPELPPSIVEDPDPHATGAPPVAAAVVPETAIPGSPAQATEAEGLRHRGTPTSTSMQQQAMQAPAAQHNGGVAAAAQTAETRQARRAAAGAERNRQTSILRQLLKPPGNKREWLVMIVDCLLFGLSLSVAATAYDMGSSPPKFTGS